MTKWNLLATFLFEFPDIEDSITGEKYREVTPLGVNEMYANANIKMKNKKESAGGEFVWNSDGTFSSEKQNFNSKKGRKLTKEAIKYKNKIKWDIRVQKCLYGVDELFEDNVFYTVEINLVVPKTKIWELNKNYLRDLDNLIKGLQDCLSGTIFKDDDQVRSFFPTLYYNKDSITNIKLNVYKFDEKKHIKIQEYIKNLLK